MTTVEYINHPSHQRSFYDDEDEDISDFEEDYYDDDSDFGSEYDEIEHDPLRKQQQQQQRSWSPTVMKSVMSTPGGQYIAWSWHMISKKAGQPWRELLRRCLPGYNRYRRLHHRKGNKTGGGMSLLCAPANNNNKRMVRKRRRRHHRDSLRDHENVNMEEMLAIQTIRPTAILSEGMEDGPDYDDDMGLDMSILEEKYPSNNAAKTKTSKAARILDITDEEAMLYQQSHQDQQRTSQQELGALL